MCCRNIFFLPTPTTPGWEMERTGPCVICVMNRVSLCSGYHIMYATELTSFRPDDQKTQRVRSTPCLLPFPSTQRPGVKLDAPKYDLLPNFPNTHPLPFGGLCNPTPPPLPISLPRAPVPEEALTPVHSPPHFHLFAATRFPRAFTTDAGQLSKLQFPPPTMPLSRRIEGQAHLRAKH